MGEFLKHVKLIALACFSGLDWCHIPEGKHAQNSSAEKDQNLVMVSWQCLSVYL